ncbi:cyclic lactone autoinducer peptide [Paenibacillus sp. FSL H3-0333]
MKKFNLKFAAILGSVLTLIAVAGITPASWALFHAEEIPSELK